jgi:hypothetical protein
LINSDNDCLDVLIAPHQGVSQSVIDKPVGLDGLKSTPSRIG